jgi:hypothetical protein
MSGLYGNVKSFLIKVKKRGVNQLNVRMLLMCNCCGSMLNQDGISIGDNLSLDKSNFTSICRDFKYFKDGGLCLN